MAELGARCRQIMHINDIISDHHTTISFEFFPPKSSEGWESLYQTIHDLEDYIAGDYPG